MRLSKEEMEKDQKCQKCGKAAVTRARYGIVRSLIFLHWPERFDGWLCADCLSEMEKRVHAFYYRLLEGEDE